MSRRYFREQSDPHTGIARDRARADGSSESPENRYTGSTGATGFALTAFCIGAERARISRREARNRVEATLRTYENGPVANEHGCCWHFVDVRGGARRGPSEVSTSDSTWLVAGALIVRQYFREDHRIAQLASTIYERVDYGWMRNGHPFCWLTGGHPKTDFIQYRYDRYCQLACMYLLGIASPTHPLNPQSRYAWDRQPFHYAGFSCYGRTLLWTYQYSFCWRDFRNRRRSRGSRVD